MELYNKPKRYYTFFQNQNLEINQLEPSHKKLIP